MFAEKEITFVTCLLLCLGKMLSGQQLNTQCFGDRLHRCQQHANSIIGQIPADFLPPSSVGSDTYTNPQYRSVYQDLPNKCSMIRSDLDCMLTYTAGCVNNPVSINAPNPYGPSPSSSHPNEIYKAKQFLDKFCDNKYSWRNTQCFSRSELRNCEASLTTLNSGQPCQNFNTFRSCSMNYMQNNCVSHEMVYLSSYLMDKASDQAWKCSPGDNYISAFGSIDRISNYGSGSNYGVDRSGPGVYQGSQGGYGSSIYGSSIGSSNYGHTGGSSYGQTGGYPSSNYGQSGYGTIGIGQTPSGAYGQGYVDSHAGHNHPTEYGDITRQIGVGQPPYAVGMPGPQMPGYGVSTADRNFNLFPAENCVERSVYFARSCEDFLLQRQREARNARTGIDVQRRLCCSLFFYHDCLSKTVIQYCRDASPTTVDIMMGQRKREMAITCRDFSREQCSSAEDLKAHLVLLLLLTSTVSWLFLSSS